MAGSAGRSGPRPARPRPADSCSRRVPWWPPTAHRRPRRSATHRKEASPPGGSPHAFPTPRTPPTRTWVSASLSAALRMASAASPGYRPKARMISMRINGSLSVRIDSANCCEMPLLFLRRGRDRRLGQLSQFGHPLGRRHDAGNRIRDRSLKREPGGQKVKIGAAARRGGKQPAQQPQDPTVVGNDHQANTSGHEPRHDRKTGGQEGGTIASPVDSSKTNHDQTELR